MKENATDLKHPRYAGTDRPILMGDVVFETRPQDGEDVRTGPYVVYGIVSAPLGTLISLEPYRRLGTRRPTATEFSDSLELATDEELAELEERLRNDNVMSKVDEIRKRGWRIVHTISSKGQTISLVDTGGVPIWHVPMSRLREMQGDAILDHTDLHDITDDDDVLANLRSWEIPDDVIADLTHDVDPQRAMAEMIDILQEDYEMPRSLIETMCSVISENGMPARR